jgi:hypothetical protein
MHLRGRELIYIWFFYFNAIYMSYTHYRALETCELVHYSWRSRMCIFGIYEGVYPYEIFEF